MRSRKLVVLDKKAGRFREKVFPLFHSETKKTFSFNMTGNFASTPLASLVQKVKSDFSVSPALSKFLSKLVKFWIMHSIQLKVSYKRVCNLSITFYILNLEDISSGVQPVYRTELGFEKNFSTEIRTRSWMKYLLHKALKIACVSECHVS